MKKPRLVALGIIAALGIAIFYALYLGGSALVLDVAGQGAPDTAASGAGLLGNRLPYFDLPNLAGERVRSSDFADTPLVVVFWSTWNAPAADQMHILDQYLADQSSRSNRLVKIVAIDSQEERSIVSSFMKRGGYQVPALLDAQGIAGEQYAIKSLPTFYFIDRAGIVREIYSGMLNQSALINKLEKILQ
jgi:cytochrome c biogenesis protein CcmG, thiol:disulfide interchange protein DsbE